MPRGRRTDKKTEDEVLRLHDNGMNYAQIARKTGLFDSTVKEIVRRRKTRRRHYPPHCYTCEYSIYSDVATSRGVMPDVVGCLMRCDTPKTCRNWNDDQMTAERVKACLRGK